MKRGTPVIQRQGTPSGQYRGDAPSRNATASASAGRGWVPGNEARPGGTKRGGGLLHFASGSACSIAVALDGHVFLGGGLGTLFGGQVQIDRKGWFEPGQFSCGGPGRNRRILTGRRLEDFAQHQPAALPADPNIPFAPPSAAEIEFPPGAPTDHRGEASVIQFVGCNLPGAFHILACVGCGTRVHRFREDEETTILGAYLRPGRGIARCASGRDEKR